jgi:hypothetical protein
MIPVDCVYLKIGKRHARGHVNELEVEPLEEFCLIRQGAGQPPLNPLPATADLRLKKEGKQNGTLRGDGDLFFSLCISPRYELALEFVEAFDDVLFSIFMRSERNLFTPGMPNPETHPLNLGLSFARFLIDFVVSADIGK